MHVVHILRTPVISKTDNKKNPFWLLIYVPYFHRWYKYSFIKCIVCHSWYCFPSIIWLAFPPTTLKRYYTVCTQTFGCLRQWKFWMYLLKYFVFKNKTTIFFQISNIKRRDENKRMFVLIKSIQIKCTRTILFCETRRLMNEFTQCDFLRVPEYSIGRVHEYPSTNISTRSHP